MIFVFSLSERISEWEMFCEQWGDYRKGYCSDKWSEGRGIIDCALTCGWYASSKQEFLHNNTEWDI